MDEIIRAVSKDGFAKISVVTARDAVQRANAIHHCSPTAIAALGRSLCAASMLGDLLKEENGTVTLRINGGGGLGTVGAAPLVQQGLLRRGKNTLHKGGLLQLCRHAVCRAKVGADAEDHTFTLFVSTQRKLQQCGSFVQHAALHNGGQQSLQGSTHGGAGGQAGFHQVAAVYGQLAHGVAGGLGKLGHPGLKGGHLVPPGFDLRRVGVGVQVGIFQRAEPVQKHRAVAVETF